MRAAGIRFAEGCYQNELAYTLTEKGTLRFGLKCDVYKGDCWCCFDNFELLYQALPDFYDAIEDVRGTEPAAQDDIYDLSGRKVTKHKSPKGIVIRNGKKTLE